MSQAERQRRRAARLHHAVRQEQRVALSPEQLQVFKAVVDEHGRRLATVRAYVERLIQLSRAGFSVTEVLDELLGLVAGFEHQNGEMVKPNPAQAAEES